MLMRFVSLFFVGILGGLGAAELSRTAQLQLLWGLKSLSLQAQEGTRYVYDSGAPQGITQVFNPAGLLVREKDAQGNVLLAAEYDEKNHLVKKRQTPREGEILLTEYTWDSQGRVVGFKTWKNSFLSSQGDWSYETPGFIIWTQRQNNSLGGVDQWATQYAVSPEGYLTIVEEVWKGTRTLILHYSVDAKGVLLGTFPDSLGNYQEVTRDEKLRTTAVVYHFPDNQIRRIDFKYPK